MTQEPRQPLQTLRYRLAKGVTPHEKDDGIVLVLGFPLKTLSLHPAWKNVLRCLSGRDFVVFQQILPLVKNVDADRVEYMLDDLVLKGFLEQRGIPALVEFPLVSIIIPVRNRPEEIGACLKSLEDLDYPSNRFEIIVVDDASTDHTPETISRFPVRLIRLEKNRQAPFCRNLAAWEATGEILAFVDSDCLVDPNWLKELLPTFKAPSVVAVGGRVDAYFNKTGLDRYETVSSSLIMGRHAMRSQERDIAFYVPSCNLLVRRSLFLAIGGFREELVVGEDVDLCWRIQDQSCQVAFQPVGKVFHKHRNHLIPFCRRRFDYGASEPLLQKLHEKRSKRMAFPVAGSLFLVVGILAMATAFLPLLSLCGGIAIGDTLNRLRTIRKKGVPVGIISIFFAVLRGYAAFAYHLSAFVSRYYMIWAILLFPVFPTTSTVIFVIHLVVGIVGYVIKKPRLNPFSFLFYFTMDQVSYQLGVWWGCLKHRTFGSVNPKVVWSTFSRKI